MLAAPGVFKMKTTKIEKFHVHENQNECNTRSGNQMFVFTVAVNIAKRLTLLSLKTIFIFH